MAEKKKTKIIQHARDFRRQTAESIPPDAVVVLSQGVYDVLHPGHLAHLQEAKSYGDVLVVSVAADNSVRKGPGRPIFNQQVRMEQLAALETVDYVVLCDAEDHAAAIKTVRPQIYARGPDYPTEMNPELEALKALGGELRITTAPTDSSSRISTAAFITHPPETEQWLEAFRSRHSVDKALSALESIRGIKVLIIGEASENTCTYVKTLGALPEECHLSAKAVRHTKQPDVTQIIMEHVSGFTSSVKRITQQTPIEIHDFIELESHATLFATLDLPDPFFGKDEEADVLDKLQQELTWAELVIIADYGHGMISSNIQQLLEKEARFLAATVKTYHGNLGFNLATKYKRMDYLALNDFEYRLAAHDGGAHFQCGRLMVTKGKEGCQYRPRVNVEPIYTPSLAVSAFDSCGAGDALLAYTAPLAEREADPEILAFIGNCAAAMHCEVPINSQPVHNEELHKFVKRLLG